VLADEGYGVKHASPRIPLLHIPTLCYRTYVWSCDELHTRYEHIGVRAVVFCKLKYFTWFHNDRVRLVQLFLSQPILFWQVKLLSFQKPGFRVKLKGPSVISVTPPRSAVCSVGHPSDTQLLQVNIRLSCSTVIHPLSQYFSSATVPLIHRVGRVLSFFSHRRYWDSPNPSSALAPPPFGSGGRGSGAHSLARGGMGVSQFRRRDIHCGTL
jgi:hypothetical protein